jgi:hypothetical protein
MHLTAWVLTISTAALLTDAAAVALNYFAYKGKKAA